MNVSEWRSELKAAYEAVTRESEALVQAKAEVRERLKSLEKARKREAEIRIAFISGQSQLPLFEESVEEDEPTEVRSVEPLAEPDTDDWARTPLNMVVVREDLLGWLLALDLNTLGDLSDACQLCGSLKGALDDWTVENAAEVERDVRTWSSRRPGFPLDVLRRPEPKSPAVHGDPVDWCELLHGHGPGPTAPLEPPTVLETLYAACYSTDLADWSRLRREGASDLEILDKLREIWPDKMFVRIAKVPGKSDREYTTLGGESPEFWPFDAFPPAATMPAAPYLRGVELCEAIRRALDFAGTWTGDDGEEAGTARNRPGDSREDVLLRRSLHHHQGAADRWAESIANGETDQSLKERLRSEFGIEGYADGVWHRGGSSPAVWFGCRTTPDGKNLKPDLQGKALLAAVRKLLGIPVRTVPAEELR